MKKLLIAFVLALTLSASLTAQTALNKTTLATAVTSTSATTVTVASATGITTAVGLIVDSEYMSVSAVSGTTITVTRGAAGTPSNTHASAAVVIVVPGGATVGPVATGSCTVANQQYQPTVNITNGFIYVGLCRYTAAAQSTRRWAWTSVTPVTYNSILWCEGSGC